MQETKIFSTKDLPIKVKKAIFAGNAFIRHMSDIQMITDDITNEELEKLLESKPELNKLTSTLIEVCETISEDVLDNQ